MITVSDIEKKFDPEFISNMIFDLKREMVQVLETSFDGKDTSIVVKCYSERIDHLLSLVEPRIEIG